MPFLYWLLWVVLVAVVAGLIYWYLKSRKTGGKKDLPMTPPQTPPQTPPETSSEAPKSEESSQPQA